jgi:hypothetical protein
MDTKQIITHLKKARKTAEKNKRVIKELEKRLRESFKRFDENTDLLRFMQLKGLKARYYDGDIVVDVEDEENIQFIVGKTLSRGSIMSISWKEWRIDPHGSGIGLWSIISPTLPVIRRVVDLLTEKGEGWK